MLSIVTLFRYIIFILPTSFIVWFIAVFTVMLVILGLKIYQFVKACLPFNG